tara:strand:+ start:201 stop:473 length:273 start_codon:yes stop_codon:yes gene_type:complete
MPISKKRAPHVSADNLERILAQVYDDLNEVIDSVNQETSVEERKGYEGKSGDVRVARDPTDKKYYLEMRADEGWVRSDNASTSGFSFKDK